MTRRLKAVFLDHVKETLDGGISGQNHIAHTQKLKQTPDFFYMFHPLNIYYFWNTLKMNYCVGIS